MWTPALTPTLCMLADRVLKPTDPVVLFADPVRHDVA